MEHEYIDDGDSGVSNRIESIDDLESKLLEQFRIMGTNDKDVLIGEFQKLLGGSQNYTTCQFFLEMNNWNLQDAVGSYYDYEQVNSPMYRLPSIAVLKDTTIGEGESVAPSSRFVKRWEVKNTGQEPWPPGCCLKYVGGCQFGTRDRLMVDSLSSYQTDTICLELLSPDKVGYYQGQWRMCTPTGIYFGDILWVVVQVEENGLMAVTQQLAQIGAGAAGLQHGHEDGSNRASVPPPYAGLSLTPNLTPIGSPIQGTLPQQSHSYPGSPLQPQLGHQSHNPMASASFTARRDLSQSYALPPADDHQADMDFSN